MESFGIAHDVCRPPFTEHDVWLDVWFERYGMQHVQPLRSAGPMS